MSSRGHRCIATQRIIAREPDQRASQRQLACIAVGCGRVNSAIRRLQVSVNETEAASVLAKELARYRGMSYAQLLVLLDDTTKLEVSGPTGANYQIDIQVLWDYKPDGDLRVLGAIDDGGWRAFLPLTDSFIMRPNGTFVGE